MATDDLLLQPELVERLADCEIALRRQILGAAQGGHRARTRGAAVEFAGHRPYAPGDPVHRIDWKAYARSDRYLLRQHEEDNRLEARILVDVSESMAFKQRGGETTRNRDARRPPLQEREPARGAVLFDLPPDVRQKLGRGLEIGDRVAVIRKQLIEFLFRFALHTCPSPD